MKRERERRCRDRRKEEIEQNDAQKGVKRREGYWKTEEGEGKQEGGERDVNDRDYWEIRRICQGNRLGAITPLSAGERGRIKGEHDGSGALSAESTCLVALDLQI